MPEDLLCVRNLFLYDCPRLTKIPDSCIAFSENLILRNCPSIIKLPDIRIVFGNLNIEGTQISYLPKNIKIGGCLGACNSKLKTLPNGIRIGGYVDLSNCKELVSLPDGLIINGNLDLDGSAIKQLPNGLIVGGSLNILSTGINAIPSDLKVRGKICCSKRLASGYEKNNEVPFDLPYLIWKDSSYIYYDENLYRILYYEDYSWKVIDAESVVRIILDMDSYIFDIYDYCISYIIMDINHNYGGGPTYSEAFRSLQEGMRLRMQSDNLIFNNE